MMKRILMLMMVTVFVMTAGFIAYGADDARAMEGNMYLEGFPIIEEEETIEIAAIDFWSSPDYNTKQVIADYEEKTNVHVKWDQIPGGAQQQKIGLMFASGDLPDAFFMLGGVGNYVNSGLLRPVEDLIDKYAPNIKKALEKHPEARKLSTYLDGNMYVIPSLDFSGATPIHDIPQINKKWLEKLDLEIPTTTEEFYNILKAFKEQDPNGNGKADEIPLSLVWDHGVRGAYSLFGSWGVASAFTGPVVIKDDNKIIASSMEPGYKEAIKYFHMLYSEGLIDEEAFTQDNKAQAAKTSERPYRVGAWSAWGGWNTAGSLELAQEYYTPIPPLKGPDGEQNWLKYISGIRLNNYISATCENPELVIRYIDGIYDPLESIQWTRGPLGRNIKKTKNSKYTLAETPEGVGYGQFRIQETFVFPPLGITRDWAEENWIPDKRTAYKNELDKVYEPYLNLQQITHLKLTEEEQDTVTTLSTDIQQYIENKEAEWVMRGGVEEEWDNHVKQLKKMGIDKLINIYQRALDRYNSF